MKILLNYFKPSGKWYAQGELEDSRAHNYSDCVGVVGALIKAKCLPGLRSGHSEFIVHMIVEGCPLPHIFMPQQEPDIIQYLRERLAPPPVEPPAPKPYASLDERIAQVDTPQNPVLVLSDQTKVTLCRDVFYYTPFDATGIIEHAAKVIDICLDDNSVTLNIWNRVERVHMVRDGVRYAQAPAAGCWSWPPRA